MSEQSEQLRALHARLDAQDAQIAELRQALAAAGATPPPAPPAAAPSRAASAPAAEDAPTGAPTTRRDLLRTAALSAAGGAVLLAAGEGLGAAPAAAANGDALTIGTANTGTGTTSLTSSSTAAVLRAGDSTSLGNVGAAVVGVSGNTVETGVYGYASKTYPVPPLPPTAPAGVGVTGYSPTGTGVLARGRVNARYFPEGSAPASRQLTTHSLGQVVCDGTGDLWLCTTGGTPGTWRKMGGPATAGQLHVLPSTIRVYDSRAGFAPAGVTKGQLANGAVRVIDTTLGSAVPLGASAALVNLTVTNTSPAGFLALFANGIAWPGNSSINWDHTNQSIANLAVVALDAAAKLQARVNTNCSCDFLLDVIGYYR